MVEILVLYHSRHGSVAKMARHVARGVAQVRGAEARLRTVPGIVARGDPETSSGDAEDGPPFASPDDLRDCAGLVLGSPGRFGNMAAPLKHFLESTTALWLNGDLVGKPAGVFTSTGTLHGGQESVLLTMMNPLLHHGMLLCGLPNTLPELRRTQAGGTPYGASHVAGTGPTPRPADADELSLCEALGRRVAHIAVKLAG